MVRGCVEIIADKYNLSKPQAIQYFLEIIRLSNSINEYLIYDIANAIGIPQDELLDGKQIQMNVLSSLANLSLKSSLSK